MATSARSMSAGALSQRVEPADAHSEVFDRFWRGDQARVGPGTGLGLSSVAGIAAEHGGTATAANVAAGGAVFTLRLPAAAAGVGDPGHPAG
jgi:signal transduction histidine kinase